MSDILDKIFAYKRDYVAECKAIRPIAEITARLRDAPPVRGFADNLTRTVREGRYGLIAEIKKASPSAGLIREDFDPAILARAYETGGAACLSVLTDEPSFQGKDDYLVEARAACSLPVLRKDFMVDPYQIAEARLMGADCILIIMAGLSDSLALKLEEAAHDLGMDALIEVHDEEEMERALKLSSPLIGINNRNLKIMKTDLATTERLADMAPPGSMLVSESGLKTPDDLARMARAGARRFLIGESLMRQDDVASAVRDLLANPLAA